MLITKVDLLPCTHRSFLLGSTQRMHAAISEAFDSSGVKRWHLDETNNLLVISEREPTSQQSLPGVFSTVALDPLRERLQTDTRVAFTLHKACTVRNEYEKGKRGRQVVQRTEEAQQGWLLSRESQMGVEVEQARIVSRGTDRFTHGKGEIVLTWATFQGIAQVKDADVLWKAVCEGVGSKSGWGCGLLSVLPIAG